MARRKLVVINNCTECPHSYKERTLGAVGYAEDYKCRAAKGKVYAGYVDWRSELPKDGEFPTWCPLQEAEEGMYLG